MSDEKIDVIKEEMKLKGIDQVTIDGWTNVITSIGTARDKRKYTEFLSGTFITDQTLKDVWINDGYGKKIISAPADDMTREWISIENDDENKILNFLKTELQAKSKINLALKWARLFGGSVIIIGMNDGQEIEKPVNIERIKSVDCLYVVNRTNIEINTNNFQTDSTQPDYGELETFTINPIYGNQYKIHKSRCMIFKGNPIPEGTGSGDKGYWGVSVLQSIWSQLRDFSSSFASVGVILQEFIIGKYKFKGLADMLGAGNEDKLRNRINAIDLSKSIINSVIIDSEEDYMRDVVSLTGLSEILDRFMMFISGVSEIPVTRLFGRSPAGQNATGESDLMNYYDMIKSEQGNTLEMPLQELVDYVNALFKVDNPIIKFNSLIQMSEKEEIETRKIQADIDNIYINNGVLTPEEVTESRFANGYSFETVIDLGETT